MAQKCDHKTQVTEEFQALGESNAAINNDSNYGDEARAKLFNILNFQKQADDKYWSHFVGRNLDVLRVGMPERCVATMQQGHCMEHLMPGRGTLPETWSHSTFMSSSASLRTYTHIQSPLGTGTLSPGTGQRERAAGPAAGNLVATFSGGLALLSRPQGA